MQSMWRMVPEKQFQTSFFLQVVAANWVKPYLGELRDDDVSRVSVAMPVCPNLELGSAKNFRFYLILEAPILRGRKRTLFYLYVCRV